MITAFIDETGTDGGQAPSVCVAATLFTDDGLARFKAGWLKLSAPLGGQAFHTLDCVGERGPFKGWSVADRTTFLTSLAQLIRDSSMSSFVANIDRGEFAAWARDNPQNVPWLRSEYATLMFQVIRMIALKYDTKVHYVIEDSTNHRSAAKQFFSRMKIRGKEEEFRVAGPPEFRAKGDPGLVAPDLLAWCWQRWNKVEDKAAETGQPPRDPMADIWTPAAKLLFPEPTEPLGPEPLVFARYLDRQKLRGVALMAALLRVHKAP